MRRLTLDYLRTESGAGLILIGAGAAAFALANSPWGGAYFAVLGTPVPVRIGAFAETLSIAGWVRDGLMTVFFLVLGMGLKFELTRGDLVGPRRFALPALAAAGGLAGPVLLFLALDPGGDAWPAALATDGALGLAVLGLAAPGVAPSLRVLLMSVALGDNLVAAALAALFAPGSLHMRMVVGAATVLALLALLSRWRRAPFLFYAAGIVVVWGFALKSGLDPALSGAACALTVPVGARRPGQESTLKYFMESLHPYVAFAILPIFTLTAAGFALRQVAPADLVAPPALALTLALWLGKPLGVFGLCALGLVSKLVRRPTGAQWAEILGVALLSGAGFAVSLFVLGATPADDVPAMRAAATIASALSGLGGAWLLSSARDRQRVRAADQPTILSRPSQ